MFSKTTFYKKFLLLHITLFPYSITARKSSQNKNKKTFVQRSFIHPILSETDINGLSIDDLSAITIIGTGSIIDAFKREQIVLIRFIRMEASLTNLQIANLFGLMKKELKKITKEKLGSIKRESVSTPPSLRILNQSEISSLSEQDLMKLCVKKLSDENSALLWIDAFWRDQIALKEFHLGWSTLSPESSKQLVDQLKNSITYIIQNNIGTISI